MFSRTCLDDDTLSTFQSLCKCPNYESIHQVRSYSKCIKEYRFLNF